MTTPIEVTDEMRQAVYDADCEAQGHMFDVSYVVGGGTRLGVPTETRDRLPYVICLRCRKVWIVMEDPGADYAAAETRLQDSLKTTSDLSKKITKRRNDRKNPKESTK